MFSIVFRRKRANRKANRRIEHLRRKALAAAGLDEKDVNDSAARVILDEKLKELEKQHRAKGRKAGSAAVRSRVKAWRQGLRKRNGKQEGAVTAVAMDGNGAGDDDIVTSIASAITSGLSSPRQSGLNSVNNLAQHDEEPIDHPQIAGGSTNGAEAQTLTDTEPQSTTFFPPAYRPASVRSIPMVARSRHSVSPIDEPEHPPAVSEKTTAPGYYPAPTTEESESALLVAAQSDGKMPLPEASPDRTMAHIATDDKRLLERMRMGVSAPPARLRSFEDEQAGPSAPPVDVDEDGFERCDASPTAPKNDNDPDGSGDLPRPPRRLQYRGISHEAQDDTILRSSSSPQSDAAVSSAPPRLADEIISPSAPPMEDDDDDGIYVDTLSHSRTSSRRASHHAAADPAESVADQPADLRPVSTRDVTVLPVYRP